jgi:SurA N-terminal domain
MPRIVAVAIGLIVAIAVTASLVALSASGDGSSAGGITPVQLQSILQADNGYPDIVATVNGDTITGKALSSTSAALKTQFPAASDSDLASLALSSLIRGTLITQAARSLNVWPNDNDITKAVADYQTNYDQLPAGSAAHDTMYQELTMQGIDPANVASSSIFRGVIEQSMAQANIRNYVRGTLLQGQQNDQNTLNQAEDQLVSGLWKQAALQVLVPITPQIPTTPPVPGSVDPSLPSPTPSSVPGATQLPTASP